MRKGLKERPNVEQYKEQDATGNYAGQLGLAPYAMLDEAARQRSRKRQAGEHRAKYVAKSLQ